MEVDVLPVGNGKNRNDRARRNQEPVKVFDIGIYTGYFNSRQKMLRSFLKPSLRFIIQLPVEFYIVGEQFPVILRQKNQVFYNTYAKDKQDDQNNQSKPDYYLPESEHNRMKLISIRQLQRMSFNGAGCSMPLPQKQ
jgi:hypothetical protein